MVPKDDEQANKMFDNYKQACTDERTLSSEVKTISEVGNLTLLDITIAASCTAKGVPISEDTCKNWEKENYGLYGITVRRAGADGATISGTKVIFGKKTGGIAEAKMERDTTRSPLNGQAAGINIVHTPRKTFFAMARVWCHWTRSTRR